MNKIIDHGVVEIIDNTGKTYRAYKTEFVTANQIAFSLVDEELVIKFGPGVRAVEDANTLRGLGLSLDESK